MSELDVKALGESVSAWEKKLAQVRNGLWRDANFGFYDCPLCRLYFHPPSVCAGCPVCRDTGKRRCGGGPYAAVSDALDKCGECDSPTNLCALEASVKAELEYLRRLYREAVDEQEKKEKK